MRMFESTEQERIFGPKRDEVMGGRRKMNNEVFLNLYSLSIIRMMQVKEDEMRRACSTNGGEKDIGGKARRKETTRKTNM
jgi:hypothetical protein